MQMSFSGWYIERTRVRMKRKAIKALRALNMYDRMLKESGHNRQERRQFWRDVTKDPSLAGTTANMFEERG